MSGKRLRIATTNVGKLREFREMLQPLGYEVLGLEDLADFDVVEDGTTFAANAHKKAAALVAATGEAAIADDSGLSVDALDGEPGVHSARYAGVDGAGKDAANRQKLLRALADVADAERSARFVCSLCYLVPGAAPRFFAGTCEGVIGREERGSNGFGYDPIFIVPERGRTMAELPSAEKHALSHRGQALRAFLEYLRSA